MCAGKSAFHPRRVPGLWRHTDLAVGFTGNLNGCAPSFLYGNSLTWDYNQPPGLVTRSSSAGRACCK